MRGVGRALSFCFVYGLKGGGLYAPRLMVVDYLIRHTPSWLAIRVILSEAKNLDSSVAPLPQNDITMSAYFLNDHKAGVPEGVLRIASVWLVLKVEHVHAMVRGALLHELLMGAFVQNAPIVHHHNHIGVLDGGQTVSNYHGGTPLQ